MRPGVERMARALCQPERRAHERNVAPNRAHDSFAYDLKAHVRPQPMNAMHK